jgi:acetyltransferase
MTQIDYWRTMTFLAFGDDRRTIMAEATLATDPNGERAEVAISIRPDLKHRGISWTLLEHVLRYAQAQGIAVVESVESAENDAAIGLEREMGFTSTACPGDATLRIVRMELGRRQSGGR